ncbi:TPM domain-containing protein [Leptospira sp. 201903070]|uniref:TPM domain-containing protein n=1 Tax=Leptospira ainlahdjerensis TaxID=2810033 RepID=A0ABS2UCP5_9LEPT|nr:TPM domain-containing protein [Leptospira ainlahdjerensis]MBM9578146.1 TPM domain-containing protein [Leptospira ainlahdjerensis]
MKFRIFLVLFLVLYFTSSFSIYSGIQKILKADCAHDYANKLSAETKSNINLLCNSLYLDTKLRLEVVIVALLDNLTEEEYAVKYFQKYAQSDPSFSEYGIVVLISFSDRKIRIELGKIAAERMSNSEAKEIIEKDFIPYFRQGQLNPGVSNGVKAIVDWFSIH